ncbi:hypothetical protein BDF14DRAFT_1808157 [Spinellus fusiger]|nr:hypothetical protein BDF14DRAFT_1808157 [Spinellus fusiger]
MICRNTWIGYACLYHVYGIISLELCLSSRFSNSPYLNIIIMLVHFLYPSLKPIFLAIR